MKPGSIWKKYLEKEKKNCRVPRMLLTVIVVSVLIAAVPQKAFSSGTEGKTASTSAAGTAAASTADPGASETAGTAAASTADTGTAETSGTAAASTADPGAAASSEALVSSVRPLLEKYAAGLNTLYGKTFKGVLWKPDKKEHKETLGYDYSDLPVGNAASCIYDFDQDGEEELLTVSINEDYTLTLTMFETGEDNKVHSSASFLSVLDRDGKKFPIYAVEQGEGMTDVFLYENNGPKVCIDSAGKLMNTSGGRHAIIALTYDGTAFEQYKDPFFAPDSEEYYGDLADNMCRSLESFGAENLTIGELNGICLYKTPFMEYLPEVREIYRADAELTVENDVLNEWTDSDTEDSIEVTSIHFKDENELYDHEKAERFPEFLSGNTHKTLPFCEELIYHGTLYWRTTFAASGKDGNLYRAGYSRLDFDKEALVEGTQTRFGELELTFWATKDEIYLIDQLSEEDRRALLENGTLPDNAALVCSTKDMPDSLEKGEKGKHQSIETSLMGYVQYRRYQVPYTNFEPRYLLSLIWKKGEGLIGYQNKRTPAGAECIQIWNPDYLERDGFDLILK